MEKKIGQPFVDCYGETPAAVDAYAVAERIPDNVSREERVEFWKALDVGRLGYDNYFGVDSYRTSTVVLELIKRGWLKGGGAW